ncbi:hypothetical protein IWX48DRAFT_621193, partial [Phyllosticta citricarpa]
LRGAFVAAAAAAAVCGSNREGREGPVVLSCVLLWGLVVGRPRRRERCYCWFVCRLSRLAQDNTADQSLTVHACGAVETPRQRRLRVRFGAPSSPRQLSHGRRFLIAPPSMHAKSAGTFPLCIAVERVNRALSTSRERQRGGHDEAGFVRTRALCVGSAVRQQKGWGSEG